VTYAIALPCVDVKDRQIAALPPQREEGET